MTSWIRRHKSGSFELVAETGGIIKVVAVYPSREAARKARAEYERSGSAPPSPAAPP